MVPFAHQKEKLASEQISDHALGKFAYAAVQKHYSRIIRYESKVLKDNDIEPLHQMRVGLRRLRTTLNTYGFTIHLPKNANELAVKKLAKTLGRVRDLDVLIQKLEETYYPALPPHEQHVLNRLLSKQQKHRKKNFSKLVHVLKGKQYKRFKHAYEKWLDKPDYTFLSSCPVNLILPDLLMPLISQLFLHPGWFVGGDLEAENLDPQTLSRWLDEDGTILHELRKTIKHVRYQAEFLEVFYDDQLADFIEQCRVTQDMLGQLQDCWVFNQILKEYIDHQWSKTLPTLAEILQEERFTVWQEWKPIYQAFLDPSYRNDLRHRVVSPSRICEVFGG